MIRIIFIFVFFIIAVFLIYHLGKYLRVDDGVKWLFGKIRKMKMPKLNLKYYSLKRRRTRKELNKLFQIGLLKGKKKFFPQKEIDKLNYDIHVGNDVAVERICTYETRYQIIFSNLSTVNIIRIFKNGKIKSFISLESGDVVTTEPISNYRANKYVDYFRVKDQSVENLKRTVNDVINESERATYLNKLKEIDTFTKEIDEITDEQ